MRTRPLIYLAGPYGADTGHERDINVEEADRAAQAVFEKGAIPVYTHRMYHRFFGRFDEAVFIEGGLSLVKYCDAVWCYAGPELTHKSNGTKGEIRAAEALGIPWNYSLDELLDSNL